MYSIGEWVRLSEALSYAPFCPRGTPVLITGVQAVPESVIKMLNTNGLLEQWLELTYTVLLPDYTITEVFDTILM